MSDTIFALSTVPGRSGVAVVRLSGPTAGPAIRDLTGRDLPAPRTARLRTLVAPEDGAVIDRALVLWFPGPRSFTGEDMAEFHLHGGRAVIDGLTEALSGRDGVRPAEPGEFARRAFDNGKLDLTAVEGLADLVNAETGAQRRQALRQMDGHLANRIEDWSRTLTRGLAHVEAALDFPDEDVPDDLLDRVLPAVEAVRAAVHEVLAEGRRGEILRDGVEVAILGPPNVGKSSILNALARRDVAIVSDFAGTTRDVVEVRLDLGGVPAIVADTAGLRDLSAGDGSDLVGETGSGSGSRIVELEGIRRSLDRAERADIKIVVQDVSTWPTVDPETARLMTGTGVLVLNKLDLVGDESTGGAGGGEDLAGTGVDRTMSWPAVRISATEGWGLDQLLTCLEGAVQKIAGTGGDASLTRARHRRALEDCVAALDRVRDAGLPELAAEDLRSAVRALGRLTGRVDVEDILDRIFRDFCIGK